MATLLSAKARAVMELVAIDLSGHLEFAAMLLEDGVSPFLASRHLFGRRFAQLRLRELEHLLRCVGSQSLRKLVDFVGDAHGRIRLGCARAYSKFGRAPRMLVCDSNTNAPPLGRLT